MTASPETPNDRGSQSRFKAVISTLSQVNLRAGREVPVGEVLGFSRWLLVIPFVLFVLFIAGQVALMRQPVVAAADTRSMLSADYSPWEIASFAPVDIEIISEIQGEPGVKLAGLVVPGEYWPEPPQALPEPTRLPPRATAVAALPTSTPRSPNTSIPNSPTSTATNTPVQAATATASLQPTATYTRTPTVAATSTPVFTLFPTDTATPTRRPPDPPTATSTPAPLPSSTPTRTPSPVPPSSTPQPSATQPPPTQTPTNTSVPPTATVTTPPATTPPPPPTPTDTPVPVNTPTSTPITPVPVETPTPLPPPLNGAAASASWDACWYLYQNYLPREIILPACQHLPAQTQP